MQLVEPRPSRPIPIRITPLIDVVFILLVFFMLTTRLLPVDYLELANNTSNRSPITGEPLPELTVTANGKVQWQGQAMALDQLMTELGNAGITEVNLATTGDTPLGAFTRVLSSLVDQGIDSHWKRTNATTP
ncbi:MULTISPECIES: ExbD/TolR family protein [Marinobacter]|jgi:biopolymer transport protein ExbD|uniref:Biopolymer transporter ExbD n=4 Tax=Marinobacter TaxID=2742 RepID=A0A5M3PNY2_9GAMM|nr:MULTISPECIES: biopolymer transporter ExbD [Marinobacter]MBQ92412.1 biopolymer transporter ExbD [Marinobacter sp.]AKV96494.1 ferric siderophore transporter permease [Marinobacter sp. CP1]EHJ02649.1 ferric siderophore transport system,innermembrane protein E [Marinobacter manganoxydans MnI7-9]ODM33591.1 ferric siderophore transporter permease [Marinobacter adhaerens]PPI80868.1 biopolymer transporter ExbD [Marinobacter flavimaris]|tara:strand:- start:589 stop:984 length:396 start_codon:yes stop_codon:yes gene_type:complete